MRGTSGVEAIELADGRELACGLVVMAIGIRRAPLSPPALACCVDRGIIVDDQMQTSAEGVFAIGECAEHNGICYGLIEPCYEQAKVAALSILGHAPAG